MKKLYTLQIVLEEESSEIQNRLFTTRQHSPGIRSIVIVDEAPVGRVSYPENGAYDITSVEIEFARKVSKDQAEDAINYWGAISYVGELLDVAWPSGTKAVVSVDVSKSASDDVGQRDILELLLKLVEQGSEPRVRQGGTRAVIGVGKDTVLSLVGKE